MKRRVYLRALEPEDYKTSIHWRKDDEIWNMLGGTKYFVSEAYEKKWVENAIIDSKDVKLAVCLIESDKYIGNVYMTNINMINRSCESHILIGEREFWGQGYACEALQLAIEYMKNERGIRRFEALILESNIPSIKMHEKCGYVLEGIRHSAVFKNGRYHNQLIFAYLNDVEL